MSRVRVTLNYIDIATIINNIRMANIEEIGGCISSLEKLLDDATKRSDAEFLKGGK